MIFLVGGVLRLQTLGTPYTYPTESISNLQSSHTGLPLPLNDGISSLHPIQNSARVNPIFLIEIRSWSRDMP